MDGTSTVDASVVKPETAVQPSPVPTAGEITLASSIPAAETPEKAENGSAKRGGWPKGKKRKKIPRDQTAPRQPLTGYVRFLNDRREKVRAENPTLPFSEITKLLASEWSNLPQDEKQQYLTAAEQDRERYLQEMNAYKQSEAYRIFTQRQANKKQKEEAQEEENEKDTYMMAGFDIPIFTEEFLDHNKAREAELRQLRKSNTDYEQQNAILQKHMENMRAAVDKLTIETQQQRNNNAALQQHLQQLRVTLATGFANTPLPEEFFIMAKQRDFSSFKDILKARYDESDFMWVSRELCFKKAYNQDHDTSNPLRLQQEVLHSSRIQKLIDEISKDSGITKEKLACSVKEILQEIGHTRQVPVIRWLGYFLLKILKKTLTGLYVNEEKLMQVKKDMGRNPVVFLPSHRSYADFILMAFVMFNYDIEVPCVAAGMDFQSMWLMGRMLRDCNAFFMRRSFADDKVYKTVFDEYVKHIVTRGDAPIEFFIEGTRSRSGKSLMPKFGLLTMVLDSFFSGQVPDITIIPVNISYDRTLEEVLFAYELLGIAKPKESTSGLIKGIQMLDERYGCVFMDFCDPISLRAYASEMADGLLKYTVRVPDREQRQIVDLAHDIVDRQQKYSVLSCFNILALVLSNHVTVGNTALPLVQTTKDVSWLSSILGLMGALVQVNKNIAECVSETLQVHKSLVRLNADSEIQLVSVHTPDVQINPDRLKGYALRDDTMSMAVPLFMLQQYVNPCLHFLVGPAIITVIMQCLGELGHITKDDLFRKYQFLRSLLCHEFVLYKTWEVNDFEDSLRQLELVNIIESSTAAHLTLGNHRKLQMLFCNLLYPFLSGYLSLCQFLLQVGDVAVSEKELLRSAQRKVEQDLLTGVITHHYSLSLDTMTACLASLTAMDALLRSRIRGEYVYKVNETNIIAVVSELEKLELRPQPYKDPFELSSKHSLLITPSSRAKL